MIITSNAEKHKLKIKWIGSCRLLDGRSLGFYGELEGANRGHMHVLLDGQQTAGQVISTMVRLN